MCQPATQSEPAPTSAVAPVPVRSRFPVWLMAALLGLATVALYWPALHDDFVNYDDQAYVTENFQVQQGLTFETLKWAFVTPVVGNWHPLTMWSHMLDCQLFGLKPWGHHLASVLLHALNTALVFLFLRGLTGAFWRSALVAALFGWHPLHVESVAWVAERKDVLSGCFGLLTLIFYGRYAQKRSGGEIRALGAKENALGAAQIQSSTLDPRPSTNLALDTRLSTLDYSLALFFFALGLMSKPMLVTWPFILLLLDYWPLARIPNSELGTPNSVFLSSLVTRYWSLLLEKIPFFVLAGVSCVVTYVVQQQAGAMTADVNLPLAARVGNTLISYCRYLGKLCWPTHLAVFYPYPGNWPLAEVLVAGGLILGITVLLFWQGRRYPCMLMGWLWFVGTLVPVIGLVQVGAQAMADRYSYLPSVGLFILIIWGAYELTLRWRYHGIMLSMAGSAALVVCLGLTRQQLGYWRDSETLFRHALAVTTNNPTAHLNLGIALGQKGEGAAAIRQFQEAIRLNPNYASARNNLGFALSNQGHLDEAISQYLKAIHLKPDYAEAHYNLGVALDTKGHLDEAIGQYQEAIRLKPDYAGAHYNLGVALETKGHLNGAVSQYQEAIRLNPSYAEARNNLGVALGKKGQTEEAVSQFQEAIRLKPGYAEAHFNLGVALGMRGHLDQAISQYREAIRLNPDYAEARNNLGIVLVMKGHLDEAISQFQEAIRLKPDYADAHTNLNRALTLKNAPMGR